MKFGGKTLEWYWKAMKWPFFILVAWNLVGVVMMLQASETYLNIFGNQWLSSMLPIAIYLIAGYLATAEHKAKPKEAAWTGALTGFAVGIVGLLLMVFTFSTVIDLTMEETQKALAAQGEQVEDMDIVTSIMKVVMIISAIFSPFIAGLLGALFGWLGYLLAKKVEA